MTNRCECCGQAVPEWGGIVADDDRGEVRFNGMAAAGMTVHQYGLFRALLDAKGRVLSKEQLLDRLYGLEADDPPESKIVDVFVCKVRKVIEPIGLKIGTAWGRGYYLEAPARAPEAGVKA